MNQRQVARYGAWKSPITSEAIVSESIGLGGCRIDGNQIYWLEMRPSEGGRSVLVCRTPEGETMDVTPRDFNVRTRVHEYGGGSFLVADGLVYFSNFMDQRVYRQTLNGEPEPLTPAGAWRYADYTLDPHRDRLICVREDHTESGHEPVNTLVSIDLQNPAEIQVIASGYDFYAAPRLSPDGSQLCWLCWNHPNLPWDGTELWIADVDENGTLNGSQCVAGGVAESIFQPQWSPDGILHFVSDRTDWWNLYRYHNGDIQPLCEMDAEFGKPQWVFDMSTYSFASNTEILCTYTQNGVWYLARLDTQPNAIAQQHPGLTAIETPYTTLGSLDATSETLLFMGGSATQPTAIAQLNLKTQNLEVLRQSTQLNIDIGYLSVPQSIAFPTENEQIAYAFFYPPQNQDYIAPEGELPPLLVKSHGGPTAAASSSLNFGIQYWTSRGFAVLDVNYGGSSGYGRKYRQRLQGQWGIVDVDDCVNGAKYLAERGAVDPNRLAIAGGSAGGYTTLCALIFRDVFKAGASYYGVSDLETLARDTHKFESRYLDGLIGPYPERKDLYLARSPIHACDRLSCPVIFFQGLEDKIVPPNQAETMVEVLRAKHLPVAYIAFPGEQHGFRRAENIKRALDGEFYFYARVFGFEPADAIEPVPIENLS